MTRLIRTLPRDHVLGVQRMRLPGEHATCRTRHEPVVHDHVSMGLCVSGNAELWAGASYHLDEGALFLIPEGQAHYMRLEGGELDLVGLALCPHCARSPWSQPLLAIFERVHLGQSAVHRVEREELEAMVETLERLAQHLARRAHHSHDLLLEDGLMCVLTAQLGAALDRGAPLQQLKGTTSLAAQALQYIQRHATSQISLVDVASAVSRHPSHVASCVKEESGRTVGEWITHARMAHARQLLLASQDNVEQISEQVGFASASHFHRTFKSWHGISPGKWRREHEHKAF